MREGTAYVVDEKAFTKIQDGIIYAFQYGIITEKQHFKLLDKLNDKAMETYELKSKQ